MTPVVNRRRRWGNKGRIAIGQLGPSLAIQLEWRVERPCVSRLTYSNNRKGYYFYTGPLQALRAARHSAQSSVGVN